MAPAPRWPFLDALLEVISELSFARELPRVTAIICTAARRLTRADGITFVLKEGDHCFYADEDAIAPLWKGRRFPIDGCVSGWVMLHRQTVAIADIYADSRVPHDAYRPTFVRSLVMVPVPVEDPIAAIGAYWAEEHVASVEEIALLEALARAAALALLNVQTLGRPAAIARGLDRAGHGARASQPGSSGGASRSSRRSSTCCRSASASRPTRAAMTSAPIARSPTCFASRPRTTRRCLALEAERPKHFRVFSNGQEVEPKDLPLQKGRARGRRDSRNGARNRVRHG